MSHSVILNMAHNIGTTGIEFNLMMLLTCINFCLNYRGCILNNVTIAIVKIKVSAAAAYQMFYITVG